MFRALAFRATGLIAPRFVCRAAAAIALDEAASRIIVEACSPARHMHPHAMVLQTEVATSKTFMKLHHTFLQVLHRVQRPRCVAELHLVGSSARWVELRPL